MSKRNDSFHWQAHARVDKFTAEQETLVLAQLKAEYGPSLTEQVRKTELSRRLKTQFEPYATVESVGNLLTRLGRKRLIDRFIEVAATNGITARIEVRPNDAGVTVSPPVRYDESIVISV